MPFLTPTQTSLVNTDSYPNQDKSKKLGGKPSDQIANILTQWNSFHVTPTYSPRRAVEDLRLDVSIHTQVKYTVDTK